MKTTAVLKENLNEELFLNGVHVLLGSVFMALMAQFSVIVPGSPIPISLQTLAVFLLIVTQGKNKAALSVMAYLFQATCGLPVLAGGIANPFWPLFPTGGYLIGMLLGSYAGGWILERGKRSLRQTVLAIAGAQACIYTCGILWLSTFLGFSGAVAAGLLPFIPGAVMKLAAAAFGEKFIRSIQSRLGR